MSEQTRDTNDNRLLTLAALALLAMAVLSGCNTVSGLGEDMSAAGDAITDEAEEEKAD